MQLAACPCKQHPLLQPPQPHTLVSFCACSYVLKSDRSVRVNARAHKMSKSRGNVVGTCAPLQFYVTFYLMSPT